MKQRMKINVQLKFVFGLLFCLFVYLLLRISFSVPLDESVQVAENSELIYYLNVNYDGVDKMGIQSSDSTTADIRSGYIYVTDQLPDGLTFTGFEASPSSDGSIGAVRRSNEAESCVGKVIDDSGGVENKNNYHGLHYDETTRTVKFRVKNLNAGCVLKVGIKTTTPSLGDKTRIDFFNIASAKEDTQEVNSNQVHVWMGAETVTTYKVRYEYSGSFVPEGAPGVPAEATYVEGANVRVAKNPEIDGYTFSGWTAVGITSNNGSFTMPSHDVVFSGSFTEKPKYKVTYKLKDGTPVPENYNVPTEKQSSAGNVFIIDQTIKVGDVVNGYKFRGWSTSDVTVTADNDFLMPEKNVVLTGEFEPVKYKVTYEFKNNVTFVGMNNYLPVEQEFLPGEIVHLPIIDDSTVSGYSFLTWYPDKDFVMPKENVIVTGEWKVRNGTFKPTITKEIVNPKDYYKLGEVIHFTIQISNPEGYALKDIKVRELSANAKFIEGEGYSILSSNLVNISTLAAGATVTLTAQYKVGKNDTGEITAESRIIGALTEKPNYELDGTSDYKASVTFQVNELKKLKVCNTVNHTEEEFQYHITSSDTTYDAWFTVVGNKCKTLLLEEKEYQLTQTNNQDYEIKSITGLITSNGSNFNLDNPTNEIQFNNEYKKRGFYHATGKVVNIVPKKNR